ncbi:MAG: hypothetical protein WD269_05495 [Acidimicrobiia bacterium]
MGDNTGSGKGSALPPGFRRLGDQMPVNDKPPIPAWLVGLMIAAVIFAGILLVSRLLGFGDDPALGEGAAIGWWLWSRPETLTDSSTLRYDGCSLKRPGQPGTPAGV